MSTQNNPTATYNPLGYLVGQVQAGARSMLGHDIQTSRIAIDSLVAATHAVRDTQDMRENAEVIASIFAAHPQIEAMQLSTQKTGYGLMEFCVDDVTLVDDEPSASIADMATHLTDALSGMKNGLTFSGALINDGSINKFHRFMSSAEGRAAKSLSVTRYQVHGEIPLAEVLFPEAWVNAMQTLNLYEAEEDRSTSQSRPRA